MSVYTTIDETQLKTFLRIYSVGKLIKFQGITEGIENTNYFVTTDSGEYVLTIFETLTLKELPFYVELMAFLNEHNIPSAHPVRNNQQSYLGELAGKPCILMQRLHGRSVNQPSTAQCESIGVVLAKLHLSGKYFEMMQPNKRGTQWQQVTGAELFRLLPPEDAKLMQAELVEYGQQDLQQLPSGVVHADLFRDNVLFHENQLTGLLDFYNACNDHLLYDLAITVNDWCVEDSGKLDFDRARALCGGYQSCRTVTPVERDAWPVMLKIAAMRFWLSRLWSQYHPIEGELTFQKNPDEFKNIILQRKRETEKLRSFWKLLK